DQDPDVLGFGYALATRFEPLLVSDREVVHKLSHPPLFHFCVAGSFLYFDRLDYLSYYDEASRRALCAKRGLPFEPFDGTVGELANGVGDHRVIGIEGPDYVIDPPLSTGSRRIPVWEFESAVLGQYYFNDPQRLPARTPSIFLAALTLAMLGSWIHRFTGRWWIALLVAAAYATSPEVFVRSSYGGYFAATNFAALALLMLANDGVPRARRGWWISCLMAGALAALISHKLILVAAAVVVWNFGNFIRTRGR
ncbi:MAG: hypothetical protein GY953_16375, partial [bacterium]|nr:hypothetical protein [bacterium]